MRLVNNILSSSVRFSLFVFIGAVSQLAHSQESSFAVANRGGGMMVGKPPVVLTEQDKALAQIELKLESVLELLQVAVPESSLERERNSLINFYDRISHHPEIAAESKNNTPSRRTANSSVQPTKATGQLSKAEKKSKRAETIERRIELLKLKLELAQLTDR